MAQRLCGDVGIHIEGLGLRSSVLLNSLIRTFSHGVHIGLQASFVAGFYEWTRRKVSFDFGDFVA